MCEIKNEEKKIEIARNFKRNCFTICLTDRGKTWKGIFRLFKSLNSTKIHQKKTDESRLKGKNEETHQHNTNYSNKNHLKNLFFEGGLFVESGRPCVGLCFGKNGKIEDPFFRVGVIESSLFHHIHSELFSLKDLNARHFIWPEFSRSLSHRSVWKSFYYIQIAYRNLFFFCFWGLYKCCLLRKSWDTPNNSTQN